LKPVVMDRDAMTEFHEYFNKLLDILLDSETRVRIVSTLRPDAKRILRQGGCIYASALLELVELDAVMENDPVTLQVLELLSPPRRYLARLYTQLKPKNYPRLDRAALKLHARIVQGVETWTTMVSGGREQLEWHFRTREVSDLLTRLRAETKLVARVASLLDGTVIPSSPWRPIYTMKDTYTSEDYKPLDTRTLLGDGYQLELDVLLAGKRAESCVIGPTGSPAVSTKKHGPSWQRRYLRRHAATTAATSAATAAATSTATVAATTASTASDAPSIVPDGVDIGFDVSGARAAQLEAYTDVYVEYALNMEVEGGGWFNPDTLLKFHHWLCEHSHLYRIASDIGLLRQLERVLPRTQDPQCLAYLCYHVSCLAKYLPEEYVRRERDGMRDLYNLILAKVPDRVHLNADAMALHELDNRARTYNIIYPPPESMLPTLLRRIRRDRNFYVINSPMLYRFIRADANEEWPASICPAMVEAEASYRRGTDSAPGSPLILFMSFIAKLPREHWPSWIHSLQSSEHFPEVWRRMEPDWVLRVRGITDTLAEEFREAIRT